MKKKTIKTTLITLALVTFWYARVSQASPKVFHSTLININLDREEGLESHLKLQEFLSKNLHFIEYISKEEVYENGTWYSKTCMGHSNAKMHGSNTAEITVILKSTTGNAVSFYKGCK